MVQNVLYCIVYSHVVMGGCMVSGGFQQLHSPNPIALLVVLFSEMWLLSGCDNFTGD